MVRVQWLDVCWHFVYPRCKGSSITRSGCSEAPFAARLSSLLARRVPLKLIEGKIPHSPIAMRRLRAQSWCIVRLRPERSFCKRFWCLHSCRKRHAKIQKPLTEHICPYRHSLAWVYNKVSNCFFVHDPNQNFLTVPVINERNYKTNVPSPCCTDNVVKPLKTICSSIDGRRGATPNLGRWAQPPPRHSLETRISYLKRSLSARVSGEICEPPNTKNFHARPLEVIESLVDICPVCKHWQPVCICYWDGQRVLSYNLDLVSDSQRSRTSSRSTGIRSRTW